MMRDRLVWKLLGAYAPLILVAVIVLNFFVSVTLRNDFEEGIAKQLNSNVLLVSRVLNEHSFATADANIEQYVQALAKELGVRITVMDIAGHVLADSVKNKAIMENHADRPEVVEALQYGRGESKRFSDTLQYTMKYVAVPFYRGGAVAGVIRLAIALREVDAQIRRMYRVVFAGGLVATGVMILVGYYISKSITNPIRQMQRIAHRISEGDFSHKVVVRRNDELSLLAQSLNMMADKLQSQIAHLKKADKVRTDFVANVSHELKTPLTSIKGYVETLLDGAIDDTERAVRFLHIIEKHADSLTHMVNDLLSLSEVEGGAERLDKKDFDFKELLEECLLGFGHAFREKNLQLETDVRGGSFTVHGDKAKMNQVVVNIVDNAVKYSEGGGSVAVTLTHADKCLVLCVEDHGIGIPEKYLRRVFERFYRVDKARSRQVGGTGLGLAIVKHIVSLHDGGVVIESVLSQGTKVIVTLPSIH